MSNVNKSQISANISTPLVFKEEESVSLLDETLCVVGTAKEGPAFIPQQIRSFESNDSILNSWENIFGNFSTQNKDPGPISARVWLENGKNQVSYIRVLGTSDDGNAGFEAGDLVLSGSVTNGVKGESKFTNTGGDKGKVHFLTTVVKSIVEPEYISPYSDYLGQLNISEDEVGVITDCIMCTHGSSLYLQNDENDNINIISKKKELSTKSNIAAPFLGNIFTTIENPMIYVQGLKDSSKNVINMYNDASLKQGFEADLLNTDLEWILDKGHFVYTKFRNLNSFNKTIVPADTKYLMLTSKVNIDLEYEDFKSSFKKARTPWIVSQPINRGNISDEEKTDIHKYCKKLFRFHTYSDGDAGNNIRIRIMPRRKGDIDSLNDSERWSIFDISIYIIENNDFVLKEQFRNITLNPNDKNYICNIIGTEHDVYNAATKKVENIGSYRKTNNIVFVEVVEEIKDEVINTDLMPCGFMPYPRVNVSSNLLNTPASFTSPIIQNPLNYVGNHMILGKSKEELNFGDRYWGVLFDNVKKTKFENKKVSGQNYNFLLDVVKDSVKTKFKNVLDYTRFFKNDYEDVSKNIWVEDLKDNDTDFFNSFFHLEKILYAYSESSIKDMWDFSFYQRDGRNISNVNKVDSSIYKYVNIDDITKSNTLSDSQHSKFLCFDLMTFGGFDGFNILDNHKRENHGISIIRELSGEEANKTKGQIYESYDLAADIIIDDENYRCDVFCMPGISHNELLKKVLQKANDKQFTFIADVPERVYNDNSINGNYNSIDSYLIDPIFFKNKDNIPSQYLEEREDLNYLTSLASDKTIDDFVGQNYYSEYGLFVLNSIKSSSVNEEFLVPSSILAINSISSKDVQEPIDSGELVYPDFISFNTVINKSYIYNNNRFDSLIEKVKKHDITINPVGIMTADRKLKLLSGNTTANNNKSVMKSYHNVRIKQLISRELEDFLTRAPIFQGNSLLFSNNSKNSSFFNIKTALLVSLENILQKFVDEKIIKTFSVYVDIADLNRSSNYNYINNIVHGEISFSLFDIGPDNFVSLDINKILNNIKQFTSTNNINIINNTI